MLLWELRRDEFGMQDNLDDKSQIEEFIREYNGEGIQHIAPTTLKSKASLLI